MVAATVPVVSAFTSTFTPSALQHHHHQHYAPPALNSNRFLVGMTEATRLHASGSSTDDSSSSSNNSNSVDGSFLELTSALAKVSDSTVRNTRWTKLVLPKDDDNDDDEDHLRNQGSGGSETMSSSFQNQQQQEEYVWVLEPADVMNGVRDGPSCTVLFTGGAGLGQFPHVAYNELLQRISNRLNAVVITAPYTIGLDHFALAKDTGEKLRRGLIAYDNNNANDKKRSGNTRAQQRLVYGLAHSLGCKLMTIYVGATRQEYDGYGFMAFNNFSFAQTIKMARSFTDQIRKTSSSTRGVDPNPMGGSFSSSDWMKNAFDLAEVALGTLGIDFSPNANDMNRLIQLRYNENYQSKTRLFVMDEDNMDSSSDFLEDCRIQNSSSSTGNDGKTDVAVSGIPGGHLAPVFFQWNLDDSMSAAVSGYGGSIEDLPPEAREMAKEAMGGFQGASFGDEVALNALVDEICGWIMGKPPSRGPASSSTSNRDSSNYRIAGS